MIAFVVRRLISMLFVMFAISVLVFLIFFATPGVDPAARIAGRNADPETLAAVRHDFGLDRPLPVQYAIMMKKLFITRDLTSFVNRGAEVIPQIADAAPVTLSLVLGAAVIWVVVAIAMGAAAAVFRGTFVDPLLMVLGLIGISMPVFWLGEVVNLITPEPPARLGCSPGCRRSATRRSREDPAAVVQAADLPVDHALDPVHRLLRPRAALEPDRGAERGLSCAPRAPRASSERRVLLRHVLRTSLITFVSLFGLDFGALVGGGALLTEVVFGLPGRRPADLPVARRTSTCR